MTARSKEKPTTASWRVYKKHRRLVRHQAKKEDASEAEIVRRSIEKYCV